MKMHGITVATIRSLFLAVSRCGASHSSGAQGSAKTIDVTLTLEQAVFDELPDWIAIERGFYKKQGLNVKVQQIQSGVTGIKALIGGQVDMATAGSNGVVQANAAGGHVKFIASLLQTSPYVIVAKPDITTIDQLKGKTFAVSQFGSRSDGDARAALTKANLVPGKDVQILQLANNSQRLAGVVTGSDAATVLSHERTGELEKSSAVTYSCALV